MHLVDEENNAPLGLGDLLQHGLEPLLELAAIFGSGDQRAHVQRHDLLVAQGTGHVTFDDALRQSFGNGGLAHARLADQHWVVLAAPAQNLDDAADFLVAADHRVELAFARFFGEVAAIFAQRLVLPFRVVAGDALIAAHRGQRLDRAVIVDAVARQELLDLVVAGKHRQQQMLGRGVLVLHVAGDLLRVGQDVGQRTAETHLHCGALCARRRGQRLVDRAAHAGDIYTNARQQRGHDAALLVDQRVQQMLRLDCRRPVLLGQALGFQHRGLRLLRKFIKSHM